MNSFLKHMKQLSTAAALVAGACYGYNKLFPKTYTCVGINGGFCEYKFKHGRQSNIKTIHEKMKKQIPAQLYLEPTYGGEPDEDYWTIVLDISETHHPYIAKMPYDEDFCIGHNVYIEDILKTVAHPYPVTRIETYNDNGQSSVYENKTSPVSDL